MEVRRNVLDDFCSALFIASLRNFVTYVKWCCDITGYYLDIVVAVLKIIYKIVIGLAIIGDAAQYITQYLL